MGLERAIEHGKEKRKPYDKNTGTYAKSVDYICRNHGTCDWCRRNRLYKNLKWEESIKQAYKESIE